MPHDYLDTFAGLHKDLPADDIDRFKRLFLSADGQFVLGKILEECKFMEPCENERDMERNNFAKVLVGIIYCDKKKHCLNIHRVIDFIRKWRK